MDQCIQPLQLIVRTYFFLKLVLDLAEAVTEYQATDITKMIIVSLTTPNMELFEEITRVLTASFPEIEKSAETAGMRDVLITTATRMQDNFPYASPLYAGQMIKPPHEIARLAYSLSLFINPNNHALDGGRASSAMEKEAVAELASMMGWQNALGHLTGGGTMANLEALWIAGREAPGKTLLASKVAHYTHARLSDVLGLSFDSVPVDKHLRMDTKALRTRLERGDVGLVIATLGTTGVGSVDPLAKILTLQREFGFRLHVDAAYGGYFVLAEKLGADSRQAFESISQVDSLVIDPHKHGMQPYGCGCILFPDPQAARHYQHDSPYTYFTSDDLHLGEISLECSRPGASAVALWATQRQFPLQRGGQFAENLDKSLAAAQELFARLEADADTLTLMPPELDIVIWAPRADTAAEINKLSQRQFDAAAVAGLHLALIEIDAECAVQWWPNVEFTDDATVTCLRSCLMKPEHLDWLDEIWRILQNTKTN